MIDRLLNISDKFLNLLFWSFILMIIWLLLQVTVVATFRIPTDSMQPTLKPGDNILVNMVLGIGIGIYWMENRPTKNARRMFEQAHLLHKAGEWEASTELLLETMKISSDAMVLNIIGKNCQAMGQPEEAERWYLRSTHRLPNRIYPYYLLAKLYAEHPDVFPKEKLEWAVRMVLEKEAKVESTAIRQMREEVKKMLEEEE